MKKIDRIHELLNILRARRYPVPAGVLCDLLECSLPTLKRTLRILRDEYNAPIESTGRGYVLRKDDACRDLPGLWFTTSELSALLVINDFLARLSTGLLGAELRPFRERVERLLSSGGAYPDELLRRFRLQGQHIRSCDRTVFATITHALLRRFRIVIEYRDRNKNYHTRREISPQRLRWYGGNWYLEAWCHLREAHRTFAIDRILYIRPLKDRAALDISMDELDRIHESAYGIFTGQPRDTAILLFTPERARWVAEEQWHPDQQGRLLDDGSYELSIPFSDPRELTGEILRHGPYVEVLAPADLRKTVQGLLNQALRRYEK